MVMVAVAKDGVVETKALSLSSVEETRVIAKAYQCEKCGRKVAPFYLPNDLLGYSFIMSRVCPCQQSRQADIEKERKAQAQRKMIEKHFSESMLSDRFKNSTLNNWEKTKKTEPMYNEIVKLITNFEKRQAEGVGLIICGPPGIGKTHLISAAANVLLARGKKVIFVNIPELLKKIQASFNHNNSTSEDEIIKRLLSSDMLILDDLGAERHTGWVAEIMYVLTNGLYTRKKIVLVSTNLPMEELYKQIEERCSDRLIQMCRIVECDAPSYRMEIAKKRGQVSSLGTEVSFKPEELPFLQN